MKAKIQREVLVAGVTAVHHSVISANSLFYKMGDQAIRLALADTATVTGRLDTFHSRDIIELGGGGTAYWVATTVIGAARIG